MVSRGGFIQRSLDELGTPLRDVTFCVLDIETTGSDRDRDQITEIGAIKVCGGDTVGTFHTMVHPGVRIPPMITVLTGITDQMVATAPRIEQVLPSFSEFAAGCVLVGHNVGFDLAFLNAAFARRGDPRLAHRVVDTLPLARRLVRDEVPDCRLGTLASRFRLSHRPTHRAFDDALATADLLHLLLERAATWGVMGLDDLLALPGLAGHPQAAKLRLTTSLPRQPGVYRFRDARGEVLYVGKATNLRDRVRSYFGGDDRRKIGALLRETASIDVEVTPHVLVAEVLEARLIRTLAPRYNRAGTRWPKYCYVRLTTHEPWPRLAVATTPTGPGEFFGPLPSRGTAQLAIDALHTMFPLRRCTARLGPRHQPLPQAATCTSHQLGRAHCPCSGQADPVAYAALVRQVMATLTHRPADVVEFLTRRMADLAAQRRFEEAAATRDRAAAFAQMIDRHDRLARLLAAGVCTVSAGGATIVIEHGVVATVAGEGQFAVPLSAEPPPMPEPGRPVAKEAVDEMLVVARALAGRGGIRLVQCSGRWQPPVQRAAMPDRLSPAA